MEKLKIYLHVPKTGGTTIVRHIVKNYKENDVLQFKENIVDLKRFEPKRDYDFYFNKIKDHIETLTTSEKDKIKIIAGHIIPFGIEKLFGKEAEYYVTIRRPKDRAVSFYNYYKTGYKNDRKNVEFFRSKYLVNGKEPSFGQWCKNKFFDKEGVVENTTYEEYFKRLGYLRGSDIESLAAKFKFTALTERSDKDFLWLYHKFDIKRFLISQNKSERFLKNFSRKDKEFLSKNLKKDWKIYEAFREANSNFKKENKSFYKIVRSVALGRKVILLITQIVFDLNGGLRILSAEMRRRSALYSKILDRIKKVLNIYRFLPE